MELKDICQYVSDRVATTSLSTSNYISTENMLPNKGGVVIANGLPLGNAVAFAKNDVLVSNIRPYFKKIWQANKNGGCSADVLCFRKNENVDNKYFYYLLSQQSFFDHMMLGSKGCKMPRGDKKQIMNWSFDLPSLEEQKRIADILSSLDSKIELNRRINDNLEQQAQLLFDNLIDASDWSTTQFLSELSEINPPRKLSKGEYAPFVEMSNMPTSGSFPSRIDYKEYNGGMKFRNGDTIMARITPCLENGKAAYVNFLKENEIGFGSTEYIVLAPKKTISSSFLYFLVRNKEFVDYAVKHMNGSSGRQRVSGDTIGNYQLPILDRNKLSIFIAIADRTLSKIRQNSFEILNLAKQRDTLLPKLMSSELKINDLNC